jgi:hypothetical protein
LKGVLKMPSRSFKNSNPGNIRYGKFAKDRGAVDDGDGYAKWEMPVQGLAAMIGLLSVKSYRDLTLLEAIKRYAPSSDNNRPQEYADFVAQRAGVPQTMKIGDMDPFQLLRVVEGMIRWEGWKP